MLVQCDMVHICNWIILVFNIIVRFWALFTDCVVTKNNRQEDRLNLLLIILGSLKFFTARFLFALVLEVRRNILRLRV